MHQGFEIKIAEKDFKKEYFATLYLKGKTRYLSQKTKVKTIINSFILDNGKIDGTKMQSNWFPQINADIFLSHSHRDEKLAIALSQWMHENFGLNVFIDSCIWGYANDLLRIIDNEFCLNSNGETYSYSKRNLSTSHIHMMLSTALSMMIDKAECVMFLNTPNSVTPNDIINKTESPWIYSEIATTRLIRQKPIEEYRLKRLTESFSAGGEIEKSLKVEYNIPTDHLSNIDCDILREWERQWRYKGKKHAPGYSSYALDILYNLTNSNNEYIGE